MLPDCLVSLTAPEIMSQNKNAALSQAALGVSRIEPSVLVRFIITKNDGGARGGIARLESDPFLPSKKLAAVAASFLLGGD